MLDKFFKTIEKIVPEKYKWVLNHDGFKRYFANTGWMFFGQMFSLIVSFFIGAWIARYLGPENYGVLSYALAFSGVFSFIASFGIDGILSRELIKTPGNRDLLLGSSFFLKLVGGFIALVLCIVGTFLFQISLVARSLIILYSFNFVLQSINVIQIYFQTEVKSKYNVGSQMVAMIITSILKISIIVLNKGVIWIMLIYFLDSIWLGIGFIITYKKVGLKLRNWKFNQHIVINLLKNSWPLMLAIAAGSIYLRIDQIMVGALLGNYKVGIYAAGVKISEVLYFIPGVICGSLFPAIVNAKKTSIQIYKHRLKNFYILMTVIPIALAIPITFFARPIIYTLFGSGYLESVNILRVYVWSSVGLYLGQAMSQYLISENSVKVVFLLNFLAMVANIILNFLFIPAFGILGSAWATLISYLVMPITFLIIKK